MISALNTQLKAKNNKQHEMMEIDSDPKGKQKPQTDDDDDDIDLFGDDDDVRTLFLFLICLKVCFHRCNKKRKCTKIRLYRFQFQI